jgi:sarcosine oxidase subunit delta
VYPMGTPRPDLTAKAAPESGTASLAADSTTTGTATPSISGTSIAPAASTASTTAPEGATK